ncbi:MAG TPA: hypothetical protein VKU60_19310, partial [Chloroflexota bacterium]|nr:hypothetical protein [Chloroflexota bacterium]
MPIRFGLASSHPVYTVIPAECWEPQYQRVAGKTPAPNEAQGETLDVLRGYVDRINAAFDQLSSQLAAYKPDALIVVSDDQGEVFDPRTGMPSIAIYMGAEATGIDRIAYKLQGQEPPSEKTRLQGHPQLAQYLAEGLLEREFDLTCVRELTTDHGLGHGFMRTTPRLVPSLDVPVIPILLNCYYPPMPSAARCLKLGQALAELLEQRPERVAIYGSGGLSHDPGGPRAGWIDRPL